MFMSSVTEINTWWDGSKKTTVASGAFDHLTSHAATTRHALPAAHYRNNRVPRDEACYTCHTDYVMYGTIKAKWRGLHHIYVQYLGNPKPPLHLYHPYNNRECCIVI